MRLRVILQNINQYGGVKRFLELGNRFVETGHSCDVFTPEGSPSSWFLFNIYDLDRKHYLKGKI
jgi:hypothetical protein